MEIWKPMTESNVFLGLDEDSIKALNFCFKSRLKFIEKNEIIVSASEKNEYCIYILEGSARETIYDSNGVESIIRTYNKGEIFGLLEAYTNANEYLSTLVANKKSSVVLFNRYRFINPCENACLRHQQLTKNLVKILAESNIEMNEKIMVLSKRTIREKVLTYLRMIRDKNNSNYFDIPFNRQELANFLAVDRSALSIELSKMKKENIIDFNKNHFNLK